MYADPSLSLRGAGRNPIKDGQRNTSHWLSSLGLVSYLSYLAQAHLPRDDTAMAITKMPPQTIVTHTTPHIKLCLFRRL